MTNKTATKIIMGRINTIVLVIALILGAEKTFCQEELHLSTQIEEYLRHRNDGADLGSPDKTFSNTKNKVHPTTIARPFSFESKIGNRISYGFHPYWSGDTVAKHYRWDLLSHIGYFGAEIDPPTGNIAYTHNWKSTALIDTAHKYGVKVELVTILFSKHDSLLLYPERRAKAIENLVKLVRDYDGDGINIDFEAIPKTSRSGFLAFIRELREYVMPDTNFSISLDLPAIDWNNIFDLLYLQQYVDIFFMMGYDYYWSAAPSAGPVAPLELGYYNLKRSVNTHLANGLLPSKFVLGLPWYGYDWPTEDSTAPGAKTLGRASALIPDDAIAEAATFGRYWNEPGRSAYYYYLQNDTIHEVWYDDEISLRSKYALANSHDLIGIGYWAIPYAASRTGFWQEIENALTPSSSVTHGISQRLMIFPNPATDRIRLLLPRSGSFEIYNLLGELMLQGVLNAGENAIALSGLRNGNYLVRIPGMHISIPLVIFQ